MDYQFKEGKPPTWLDYLILVVSLVGLITLLCLLFAELASLGPMTPTFSVESTAVKAYNLTSDNNLTTLISLGVRANNPNPNPNNISNYLLLHGVVAKVTKGKGRVLAEQSLPDALLLSPGSNTLVHVEAVSPGHMPLEREVAEEVRADFAAGEGRVNVHVYAEMGWVASRANGVSCLRVTCDDVVVDFSRSTERVQRVDCKASIYGL